MYIVAVMALLYRCGAMDTIWIFRERKLTITYIIPLRRSPRETVPWGKPNGKFSRPDAIKVERGAEMKFKASLLSSILWDMLRHLCAGYLDLATKARSWRPRYFTFTLKMRIFPDRFQCLRTAIDKSYEIELRLTKIIISYTERN